mmetsp:Transcript_27365/g.55304  ORF Transcript_27365/g.55304 Transcript_27365/m.55304 type:complete len:205 (-) Transcript_27365:124-738(-)
MAWDGRSMTVEFPPCLGYIRQRVQCVTPVWAPGLCAPGNTLDLEGRKVVKTEGPENWRCVSTETGFHGKGKYLFAFAIEDRKTCSVVFGVRTRDFSYATDSVFPGRTAEGWSYHSGGETFHNDRGSRYAEPAKTGDIIGVLLDLDVCTLSFLKNGRLLGVAQTLPANTEFFPCVATEAHGQSVVTLSIEDDACSEPEPCPARSG